MNETNRFNRFNGFNGLQEKYSEEEVLGIAGDVSEESDQQLINELLATNRSLSSELSRERDSLRESQLKSIDWNKQLANHWIQIYRKELRQYGEHTQQEVHRFYQNESMAQNLKPIVEEIIEANDWLRDQKKKIRHYSVEQKRRVCEHPLDGPYEPLEPFVFKHKALPDLLSFYKTTIDRIPNQFLEDLRSTKLLAKDLIQMKSKHELSSNKFDSNDSKEDIKPKNPLKETPIGMSPQNRTIISSERHEPIVEESSEDLVADSAEPEPMGAQSTAEVVDTKDSLILKIEANTEPKPKASTDSVSSRPTIASKLKVFETENTLNIEFDSNVSSIKTKANDENEENFIQRSQQIFEKNVKKLLDRPLAEKTPEKDCMRTPDMSHINESRVKLLTLLKTKYPDLTEDVLRIAIDKTKLSLIRSGARNGFSGLKMFEILAKVSHYIDSEMSDQLMPREYTHIVQQFVNKRSDNKCVICLREVDSDSKVNLKTQCQHWIHIQCIKQWLQNHSFVCPKCLKPI